MKRIECRHNNICHWEIEKCNEKCPYKEFSCMDCKDLECGEECGIDGHEVYADSVQCIYFES